MKRCSRKDKEKKKRKQAAQSKCMKQFSWADLDLDLLGEIRKKLYWGDHARFGGVCKTWLAAQHEKRAGDVLPWWLEVYRDDEVDNRITYHLYEPLNMLQPVITIGINLDEFFDTSTIQTASPLIYLDGCLLFSMYNIDYSSIHFLLVSILTNSATTLPQFHLPYVSPGLDFKFLKAVSTYPASPDCVFLALHVVTYHHWTIGIFRHGDAHWTTTEFDFQQPFGRPFRNNVVFIRGLFYFYCYDQKLASYDIASGELKINSFSFPATDYSGYTNQKFFAFDGDLMLLYYDLQARKYILTSYDWSRKLWIPLKSLKDRSLFISDYSVYVDSINYYGVSPNKIYFQQHGTCFVYSFENGELLKSASSGLRNWDRLDYGGSGSMWVEPPALLSK